MRVRIGSAIIASLFAVFPSFRPSVIQQPALAVNQNPVRTPPVIFHWTPAAGNAAAQVFSITGARVRTLSLGADAGRWSWDLTNEASQPVVNGAYFVVVTRGDGTAVRRRILVAR